MAIVACDGTSCDLSREEGLKRMVSCSFDGGMFDNVRSYEGYEALVFKAIEEMWQALPRGNLFLASEQQNRRVTLLETLQKNFIGQYVVQLSSTQNFSNDMQKEKYKITRVVSGSYIGYRSIPLFKCEGKTYVSLDEQSAALLVSSAKGYLSIVQAMLAQVSYAADANRNCYFGPLSKNRNICPADVIAEAMARARDNKRVVIHNVLSQQYVVACKKEDFERRESLLAMSNELS